MDASVKDNMPDGVYHTHLLQWMLPDVPSDILARMRPGVLMIDGLPMGDILSQSNVSRTRFRVLHAPSMYGDCDNIFWERFFNFILKCSERRTISIA
jgi:hypothetical protein